MFHWQKIIRFTRGIFLSKKKGPQKTYVALYQIDPKLAASALDYYLKVNRPDSTSPEIPQQLMVDISGIIKHDHLTGIQRVVRSVLFQWLSFQPNNIRIQPVYAASKGEYYYAHRFVCRFLGDTSLPLDDTPIKYHSGDLFFGLDFVQHQVIEQSDFYQALRHQGIKTSFLVHDLLPIHMPSSFQFSMKYLHLDWLNVITCSDGLVCVSKTVANELKQWIIEYKSSKSHQPKISSFHPGADISTVATTGLPENAESVLHTLANNITFLMVATIEPRKGHQQTLAAFDMLWNEGINVNLVIVGKQGWMMENFIKKIRHHLQNGTCLFLIQDSSDEYLQKIYSSATCLIAASEGEGFGLPLIEAAQQGLPILARDIPVFREVAGDHAFYFKGFTAIDLSQAIKNWLLLHAKKQIPESKNMPWLTWEQSAKNLLNIICSTDEENLSKATSPYLHNAIID